MNNLQRFAFNQARFVFLTYQTIERDFSLLDRNEKEVFDRIKQTSNGKKYLSNVTFDEVNREGKNPGTFMNLNTDLGQFVPDQDWTLYIENFKEI